MRPAGAEYAQTVVISAVMAQPNFADRGCDSGIAGNPGPKLPSATETRRPLAGMGV